MRDFLRRVFALIKKEFITIWNDPKSRAIIIMLPLMQLIIFANAATMEVRNIDVAVIDRANTVESRELISRFEHSPRFRHIYIVQNEKESQNKLDNQKVQLGIYINNDYSRNLKSGKGATVQVIGDGRQTNSSSIAANYANQIISGVSITPPQPSPSREGVSGAGRINIVVRNWFNPNLDYQWYVLTVIVAMLSVVVTLILTALSIARERELGTFD